MTRADHSGIAGVQVSVYAAATGGRQVVASTLTNASGFYTVAAPAGTCWVGFTDPRYVTQFYNDKPTLSTADDVTVGQTTANISAKLAALGSLSGKVTGPTDKAIQRHPGHGVHLRRLRSLAAGEHSDDRRRGPVHAERVAAGRLPRRLRRSDRHVS